jgi:hypothetical protein
VAEHVVDTPVVRVDDANADVSTEGGRAGDAKADRGKAAAGRG